MGNAGYKKRNGDPFDRKESSEVHRPSRAQQSHAQVGQRADGSGNGEGNRTISPRRKPDRTGETTAAFQDQTKRKIGEDHSEVLREGVGTLKTCINVDHYVFFFGRGTAIRGRSLARLFAKRSMKELKQVTGKSCIFITEPNESQRAKALWPMKAAKDREEDFYDLARKENILGRSQTRQELWREHLKDPIEALDKALRKWENQLAVRKRTLFHGSKQGQTPSHSGSSHIFGTMPEPSRPQAIDGHFHEESLANNQL